MCVVILKSHLYQLNKLLYLNKKQDSTMDNFWKAQKRYTHDSRIKTEAKDCFLYF